MVIFLLVLAGCSSMPKMTFKGFMESFGVPQFTLEKKTDHIELENLIRIEQAITDRQFGQANELAQKFQKNYRTSEYQLWVRVLQAEALTGMEMPAEAIEILKSVILTASESNEEVAAYALFYQAKAYESMGESENALASYLDALVRRDFLPNYIAEIELPMDLAQTYASLGLQTEFVEYSSMAGQGLSRYLDTRALTEKQKAQFLLRLGRMGPWQVKSSVYDQDFSRDQARLELILKSAQVNAGSDSAAAAQYLIQVLKEYEQIVQQYKIPREREDQSEAYERRQSLGFSLLDTQLTLLSATNENAVASTPEGEVRNYLEQASQRTRALLEKVVIRNPLTKESLNFRNIKKTFFIRPKQLMLEEKKKNYTRPDQDPNL